MARSGALSQAKRPFQVCSMALQNATCRPTAFASPLEKNGEFNQLDQSQQYELNSDSSPVEMEEVLNKELKPQSKNFYLTIQATFFIRICCVKELRLDSLSNFRSDLWKVEALQYPSLHIQKK